MERLGITKLKKLQCLEDEGRIHSHPRRFKAVCEGPGNTMVSAMTLRIGHIDFEGVDLTKKCKKRYADSKDIEHHIFEMEELFITPTQRRT